MPLELHPHCRLGAEPFLFYQLVWDLLVLISIRNHMHLQQRDNPAVPCAYPPFSLQLVHYLVQSLVCSCNLPVHHLCGVMYAVLQHD